MMRIAFATVAAISLAGCQTTQGAAPEAPVADPLTAEAPEKMQWLYGSGEAAGASIQAWRQLADYAIARSRERRIPQSVTMGVSGDLAEPKSCALEDGTIKPLAVVVDVDETVVLNLGYEYWVAATGNEYSPETWKIWERTASSYVRPVPGAVTGLRRLREAGITPVFNTNNRFSPEGVTRTIAAAGLGEAVHLKTLFLRGDDGVDSSNKDGRRAMIAERFCVVALAGDNLGDFADVLNTGDREPLERRELVARGDLAQLWGNGWFMLPNPVYGPSLNGTLEQVFPEGTRWSPETVPADAPAIMNEGK